MNNLFIILAEAEPNHLVQIIGAIVTLLVTIFGFVKWYLPFAQKKSMLNHELNIIKEREKTSEIYNILHDIEKHANSDRVIIFSGHNCGGFPMANKPFFTSSLYYVDSLIYKAIYLDEYKNITVDKSYNNMICEIFNKKSIILITEEMEPCQLKDYYTTEGVKESMVIYLGVKGNELYYMSVAKYDKGFSEKQKIKILLYANRIKELLLS